MSRTAQCLCGATRISTSSDPKFAIRCFCRDCQRVTGTGSAPQVGFDKDAVTVTGDLKHHFATADSGSTLDFAFCGTCGSPLLKSTTKAPDLIFIYAGALDDATGLPPLSPVFEASRAPWDT